MALDLTKLNFFNRLDARARVFVLLAGVAFMILIIYLITVYLSGTDSKTIGPSQVAGVPGGLQSVPGGTLTPEYSRALQLANAQAAKNAQMTGTSAVPTLMNYGNNSNASTSNTNCNIICTDKSDNVKYSLDEWVKLGKVTTEVSTALQQSASRNIPVSDFETELAQLVKDNKLSPEQARELLDRYKRQYKNNLLEASAVEMDKQIKSGILPLDVASQLLDAQKKEIPAYEYDSRLQGLVSDGKITPEVAQDLSGQYSKQIAQEAMNARVSDLRQMAKNGLLIPEVANQIIDLEKKNIPYSQYKDQIDKLVTAGQMTPAVADKLVSTYKDQKLQTSGSNVVTTDQRVTKAENNTYSSIQDLVKTSKISQQTADEMTSMVRKNVSSNDYGNGLAQMVKDGKISPELAAQKLEEYNALKAIRESTASSTSNSSAVKKAEEAVIQSLQDDVSSNKMSADSAKQLTDAVQKNVSVDDYKQTLTKLVNDGKITPDTAEQKLAEYKSLKTVRDTQGDLRQIQLLEKNAIQSVDQLVKSGKISPDTAQQINDMVKKNVSTTEYNSTIRNLVSQSKIDPVSGQQLAEDYKSLKALRDTPDSLQMVRKGEEQAYRGLDELVKAGKMPPEEAKQISDMIQRGISPVEFKEYMAKLAQDGKVPPDVAKAQVAQYQNLNNLRNMREGLQTLQANDASVPEYTNNLKKWVQLGTISAAQAAQLLRDYKVAKTGGNIETAAPINDDESIRQQYLNPNQQTDTADQFAASAEQGVPAVPGTGSSDADQQAALKAAQAQQAEMDAIMAAMQGQASQLVAAWQPTPMTHTGSSEKDDNSSGNKNANGASGTTTQTTTTTTDKTAPKGPPLVKAGTIIFGVLDTTVDSDYPDTPVMATIVEGKFKNAKLMGKLVITKGVSGQQDRVSLNFNLMNSDNWDNSKSVTAYAIDPDTARTALASHVDYHYMKRFGAMMATSFLKGYADSITQAGTSTTGIFGTSTVHPELSPSQKIFTALGQMGQAVGKATENYVNIPPTVKVDAGVGLGILFMADVTN